MDTPTGNTELVPWDVPFANWRGLSTWVIVESFDSFTVVVAPLSNLHPKDNYPKYLVRFDKVITMLAYDEACATHTLFYQMSGWTTGVRAYRLIDSPWLFGYKSCHEIRDKKLYHYAILGDDSIAEVISVGEAQIERVDAKRIIEVTHEV